MKDLKNSKCWIITEKGLRGTLNQCLGVVEALDIPYEIKEIELNQPWKTLSPYIGFEHETSFIPFLKKPWPDLIIAGGRKAIAACRYIKKQNPDVFCVFLQNPRTSFQIFDLIAAPEHDRLTGPHIIQTTGAVNRITPDKLAQCDISAFETLPRPRVAVLLGGHSKTHRLTDHVINKLIEQLQALKASYMITPSRRTPPEFVQKLQQAELNAFIWDGLGENPYLSMLAAADYILVTGDSVSMLSDAGTTGKPVYIIALEGGSDKFDRFYQVLKEKNVARDFHGALESWNYAPLNDAHFVASTIKTKIGHHHE